MTIDFFKKKYIYIDSPKNCKISSKVFEIDVILKLAYNYASSAAGQNYRRIFITFARWDVRDDDSTNLEVRMVLRIVRAREWHPIKVTKIKTDPLPVEVPQIVGGSTVFQVCASYTCATRISGHRHFS